MSGIDGVICLGTFGTEELKRIDELERPTIFVDSNPNYDKYDSIVFDLRRETRRILDYLWEKGHRRIGFIGGNDMEGSWNICGDGQEDAGVPGHLWRRKMRRVSATSVLERLLPAWAFG